MSGLALYTLTLIYIDKRNVAKKSGIPDVFSAIL